MLKRLNSAVQSTHAHASAIRGVLDVDDAAALTPVPVGRCCVIARGVNEPLHPVGQGGFFIGHSSLSKRRLAAEPGWRAGVVPSTVCENLKQYVLALPCPLGVPQVAQGVAATERGPRTVCVVVAAAVAHGVSRRAAVHQQEQPPRPARPAGRAPVSGLVHPASLRYSLSASCALATFASAMR